MRKKGDTQAKILAYLSDRGTATPTTSQIAKDLDLTRDQTFNALKRLFRSAKIVRVGSSHLSKWQVSPSYFQNTENKQPVENLQN